MKDLKIVMSFEKNENQIIKDLNKFVRAINANPRLHRIKLKLDADKQLTASLNQLIKQAGAANKLFQELNAATKGYQSVSRSFTSSMESVTAAVKRNNEALKQNRKLNKTGSNKTGSVVNEANQKNSGGMFSGFGDLAKEYIVFPAIMNGTKAMVDTIVEVDKQVSQLKMTLKDSTQVDQLFKNGIELSNRFGRSITEVNDSFIALADLGYGATIVPELTEALLLTQNITQLDSGEALAVLTAGMSEFGIKTEQATQIVDKMSQISRNAGVSSRELASSMQASASTAQQYGVSLEQLLGDSASIMQTTHESGLETGESLKQIYSSLTTMGPAVDVMSNLGIEIRGSNGELKTATEILDDLAAKFQTVSKAEQEQIAASITTGEQTANLMALLQNRSAAHDAAASAMYAEGAAMRQNELYMQSLEGRINGMKTAWGQFSVVLGEAGADDAIRAVTGALTLFAQVSGFVVKHLGALPTLMGTVGLTAALLSKNFRIATIAVITLGNGLKGLSVSAAAAKLALRSLLVSSVVGVVFVALGFVLEKVIGLFGGAEESQESFFETFKQNVQEIKQANSTLDELQKKLQQNNGSQTELTEIYKELSDIIPGVISHYDSEGNAVYKSKEAIDELIKSQKELHALRMKNEALDMGSSVQASADQIVESRKKIADLSEDANASLAKLESFRFVKAFGDQTNLFGNNQDYAKHMEQLKSELSNIYQQYGLEGSILSNDPRGDASLQSLYYFLNDDYLNLLQEYSQEINTTLVQEKVKLKTTISSFNESLRLLGEVEFLNSGSNDSNLKLFFEGMGQSFSDGLSMTGENQKNIQNSYTQALAEIGNYVAANGIDLSQMLTTGNMDVLIQQFPQYGEVLNRFAGNIRSTLELTAQKLPVLDETGKEIGRVADQADGAKQGFEGLQEVLKNGVLVGYIQQSKQAGATTEELASQFKSASTDIKSLNELIQQTRNGQALTSEALADLIIQYPQLASGIENTTSGWRLSEGVLESLRRMKIKEAQDSIRAQIESSRATLTHVSQRVSAYKLELDAINSLESAKSEASKLGFFNMYGEGVFDKDAVSFNDSEMQISVEGFGTTEWEQDQYFRIKNEYLNQQYAYKRLIELGNIIESGNQLEKMLQNPDYGLPKGGGGAGSSGAAAANAIKDEARKIDQLESWINSVNDPAVKQRKANESFKNSISGDESYSRQITKTSALLEGQLSELKLLDNANQKLIAAQKKLETDNPGFDMLNWLDSNGEASETFVKRFNELKTGTAQAQLQALFDQYKLYNGAIDHNRLAISALTKENKELAGSLDDIKLAYTSNYLDKRNKEIDKYDEQLKKSKQIQSLYNEDSQYWVKEQQNQIDILAKKRDALHAENNWIRERLKQNEKAQASEKLTTEQIDRLTSQLGANSDAWYEAVNALKAFIDSWESNVKNAADEAAQAIEDHYKRQNAVRQKALDKDLQEFETYINARKKLLNRENEAEDYQSKRAKLQKEELDIQRQIDLLMLDSSWEAKSKREDLEQELLDKKEEIGELELDYNRKLRADNYDDLLENKRQETEAAKEASEKKWQDELAIDSIYSELRQNRLDQNVEGMRSSLERFSLNIQTYMSSVGQSIDENVVDKINQLSQLDQLKINIDSVVSSKPNYDTATQKVGNDVLNAWSKYVENKRLAEQIGNSKDSEFQRLKKENTSLRELYKFMDGSYLDLSKLANPIFSAAKGGMTPTWGSSGKLGILHENELILNKAQTSDLLQAQDWARTLLNKVKMFDFSSLARVAAPLAEAGNVYQYDMTFNLGGAAKQSDADLFVKALRDFDRRR